jgi:hypothetical protein
VRQKKYATNTCGNKVQGNRRFDCEPGFCFGFSGLGPVGDLRCAGQHMAPIPWSKTVSAIHRKTSPQRCLSPDASQYSRLVAFASHCGLASHPQGGILSGRGQLRSIAQGGSVMIRILIYIAIAALALFNGIYSPKAITIFALQGIWYPKFMPFNLAAMVVLSGIICTILHAIVTGIPAAVFERLSPRYNNSTASALLWLAAMFIATVLTLLHLTGD